MLIHFLSYPFQFLTEKQEKKDAQITVVVIRTETTKAKMDFICEVNCLTGRGGVSSDVGYLGDIKAETFT